jgi:hypothetical protein
MKQFLVELDDRCLRDLERVAPSKKRMRAEFVRLAIRAAVDRALDRSTAQAYLSRPLPTGVQASDLAGWDPGNALVKRVARTPRRGKRAKRAA